ncbi:MAG: ArsB/NhaD family transporter [Propionibacteriaceae bacterium]|nr:ArsB/NhaD family transporter [Propionibacteriaceae bacterium]
MIVYAAAAIFLISYALIATEKVHRVAAALGGVAGMTLIGLVDAHSAFFDEHTGVDWNVVTLLFGMMVVVSVLRHTGLFEFIAMWAARTSRGSPRRLMILLILITAVFSPILDNVTTVLLVTPVTLTVCQRLGFKPLPHLIALVFASNIGGISTLIADPPNLIIASKAGLSFNDFLINALPLCIVLLGVLIGVMQLLFRRELAKHADVDEALAGIDPALAIPNRRLLTRCLVVLVAIVVAFCAHTVIPLEPSMIALLGAGAMVLVSGTKPEQFLAEVEWVTLAFFMALFVLVGALVEVGIIDKLGQLAASAMHGNELLGATGLLLGSTTIGALVDNIPYTTAMAPIAQDMVASTAHTGAASPLWWAFVFGADLGGNATAVAAGANVVVLGIAAKAGQPISFWDFTKRGLVVTAATVAVAWLYVWLRYFVFA